MLTYSRISRLKKIINGKSFGINVGYLHDFRHNDVIIIIS